jgi:serine O-acetyltransferase
MITLKCDFEKDTLLDLLIKQLSNFFIVDKQESVILSQSFDAVYLKLEKCFYLIDNKYFRAGGGGKILFNPYHSGQYLIYLYFFSNVCSAGGEKILADKLYYLNKIMHSCDIYHEVNLPESFFLEHPVGTVLGRATYGNKFVAMQSCTVGGNKGKYPTIGENVKLYSGAKILGNCIIGNNVSVAANTYIKDTDIPDNATVFGTSPNLILKYL